VRERATDKMALQGSRPAACSLLILYRQIV
jgi:hypothetical protein